MLIAKRVADSQESLERNRQNYEVTTPGLGDVTRLTSLDEARGTISEYSRVPDRSELSKVKLKQTASKARRLEAYALKQGEYNRHAYHIARNQARIVTQEMRHRVNMANTALRLEEAHAQYGTQMQQIDTRLMLNREGNRSFHDEMDNGLMGRIEQVISAISNY